MIRGRVQGVGFRAWAEVTALELGIEGWVRNRRDGSVEAVLAGSEEAVLTMIEAVPGRSARRASRLRSISARRVRWTWRCAGPANCSRCWHGS